MKQKSNQYCINEYFHLHYCCRLDHDHWHTYSGVAAFFAEVLGFTDYLALCNVFTLFQRTNTMKHFVSACLIVFVPHRSKNVFFCCVKTNRMDHERFMTKR